MSKIFTNLLFFEGGTNLIFLAGSKALAQSGEGCLPKAASFNSCWPLFWPLKVPFLVRLLILIHAIDKLLLTQPVLNLKLFELSQVVHPVKLSRHHKRFELHLRLLLELVELLHALITVLRA